MAQLFQPRFLLLMRLGFALGVLVVAAGIFLWRLSSAQEPPIDVPVAQNPPFSHKHHVAEVGIDCRYCHASVETSAFAGIPPTATCMNCHSQIFRDQQILKPVFASYRDNQPLHWRRIHHLQDFVYFNHSIHVAKGVGCSTCHGHVEQMALMWRVQSLEMEWCVDCHKAPERYLRPRDRVFDMDWEPPADQMVQGRALLAAYHVDVKRLLDCSNCHR